MILKKKTRQTEGEVGRRHQGMDRPGVWQVPEGSGEQRKMEKHGGKIICGAPTTLAVKGLMMVMIMMILSWRILTIELRLGSYMGREGVHKLTRKGRTGEEVKGGGGA